MSLTDKIFACIERNRCFGADYKISDFQLRMVGEDLTVLNLRSGYAEVINEYGEEFFEDLTGWEPTDLAWDRNPLTNRVDVERRRSSTRFIKIVCRTK